MIESIKALPGWLKLWLIFPLGFLNGWLLLQLVDYLSPFIGIFAAAAIFAFLLDLPTQFLYKRGIPRAWAIAIVMLTALLILTGVSLTIGPLILEQLRALVASLPQILDSSQRQLQNLREYAIAQNLPINLTDLLNQAINQLTGLFQLASNRLLAIVTETINSVVNVLFFIVLTIFMVVGGWYFQLASGSLERNVAEFHSEHLSSLFWYPGNSGRPFEYCPNAGVTGLGGALCGVIWRDDRRCYSDSLWRQFSHDSGQYHCRPAGFWQRHRSVDYSDRHWPDQRYCDISPPDGRNDRLKSYLVNCGLISGR